MVLINILNLAVWQNRLVALEYIHPGRNVTYECTASGGQFTVWKGSALGRQCVITLYHGHFGTKDAFGSCNNGMVVGRGIRREKDNYTSLYLLYLSVPILTEKWSSVISLMEGMVKFGLITPCCTYSSMVCAHA